MVNINLSFGRQRVAAIVDVAPGGAGVAIMSNPHDSASTLLAAAYSALSLEERSPEQAAGVIAQQIQEAAAQAMREYGSSGQSTAISEVYVILHAPWSKSALVDYAERYEAEVRIHAAAIEALARAAIEKDSRVTSANLFESSVLKVSLNGYPTPRPDGKYAHSLRVASIASECESAIRTSIEGAVQHSFPAARLVWRSALHAYMTVARESLEQDNFLLMDMGTDDTHLASICSEGIEQLVIPEGAATIMRRVSAHRTPDEVTASMRMLARDACSGEACDAIRSSLATAEPELVRVFGEAIARLAAKARVPNDVLLSAHPDIESWLSVFLARIDFAQFTLTSMPLSIHTAPTLDLSRWVSGAHSGDALALAAALVNIENRA